MRNGDARSTSAPALSVRGLNVFYGQSHALQGVDLTLDHGVVSVVGRNGMGKTTLCKAIMGLAPTESGSIRLHGRELVGLPSAEVARLGVGYVPQGRRLWRSLTVDEHLRMISRPGDGGAAWTVDRIYATFPRLAERRSNGGAQLSGGEQQMLAISRALLLNPRLLVMDEPTEGLAPVIVNQVAELLAQLGRDGDIDVLVIEQNIGVATSIAEEVAIMVNGRVNRVMSSAVLAADRDLQQRLLGVGRHGHDETDDVPEGAEPDDAPRAASPRAGPTKIYVSNPAVVTRWSRPTPVRVIEGAARIVSAESRAAEARIAEPVDIRPLAAAGQDVVLVAGTLDTKGPELRYVRDALKEEGLAVRLVDLSTSGKASSTDVPPHVVAAWHPRGAAGVLTGDRGASVAGMAVAFERWIRRQSGVSGIISAGGSGGTALATPAMRALPVGVPKVMISTVASGETQHYVGASDIMMLPSIADVQGLNSITRVVLGNGAKALAGMVKGRSQRVAAREPGRSAEARRGGAAAVKPALGMTMFGVTTPCVQQLQALLVEDHDCLVFHATGIGGRCMENLVDSGLLAGVIDITTTEVADLLIGGVFPATDDRFGAMIRAGMPYVGSVGAVDMVNFGAPPTVPETFADRLFYEHNPQVTLMRTTVEENAAIGAWIGAKLNDMTAPVRFFLPEGGVSALDAPGQAFHDDMARAALFGALEETVRQTATRQLIRTPHHINDPAFAALAASTYRQLHGGGQRRAAGRA